MLKALNVVLFPIAFGRGCLCKREGGRGGGVVGGSEREPPLAYGNSARADRTKGNKMFLSHVAIVICAHVCK